MVVPAETQHRLPRRQPVPFWPPWLPPGHITGKRTGSVPAETGTGGCTLAEGGDSSLVHAPSTETWPNPARLCKLWELCQDTSPQELGTAGHVLAGAEHQPARRLDVIKTARAALLHLHQLGADYASIASRYKNVPPPAEQRAGQWWHPLGQGHLSRFRESLPSIWYL